MTSTITWVEPGVPRGATLPGGRLRGDNAIIPLASNGGGQLSVLNNAQPAGGTVHLILDVFGYFD